MGSISVWVTLLTNSVDSVIGILQGVVSTDYITFQWAAAVDHCSYATPTSSLQTN